MTLPDPPPTDDDEPEIEPSEPEDQKDSTASGKDGSEGRPLTPEMADLVEGIMTDHPLISETHTVEMTRHLGEIKNHRLFTKGVFKCLNRGEWNKTQTAQANVYKWYVKRLKGLACNLVYRHPDVAAEGEINDAKGLLQDGYIRILKLLAGEFRFNDRDHFCHLAINKLGWLVNDAIRKKSRRSSLRRKRYKKETERKGKLNAAKEIEKGEEENLRLWKRKGKPSIDVDEAVKKYIARWPFVESRYLSVLIRNNWGESFRQIADDLKIGKSTAQEWADKARLQIRGQSRNDNEK